MREFTSPDDATAVGYAALVKAYELDPIISRPLMAVSGRPINKQTIETDPLTGKEWIVQRPELAGVLQKAGALRDGTLMPAHGQDAERSGAVFAHLDFAVRHEGINLAVLAQLFPRMDRGALTRWITGQPTGRTTRRVWYLYELLTGTELEVTHATAGNYVPVLNQAQQMMGLPRSSRRHRVVDNLLGDARFSPSVWWTPQIKKMVEAGLGDQAKKLVSSTDPGVMRRVNNYLYLGESRSSFAIEGEYPEDRHLAGFSNLLARADRIDRVDKATLLRIEREIMGSNALGDWRSEQTYVGRNIRHRNYIDYIAARPEDIPSMMDGLLDMMTEGQEYGVDPVSLAALASFGFVFVHPFPDGNGRTSRFLVHQVLAQAKFTPPGSLFPVSAVMLRNEQVYASALEAFSRPLMERIRYREDDRGVVTVTEDSAHHYRYFDATPQVEYLYDVIQETVANDIPLEISFVRGFEKFVKASRRVADLTDNQVNLFVQLSTQNGGQLSRKKRKTEFSDLDDKTIAALEKIYGEAFAPDESDDDEPSDGAEP